MTPVLYTVICGGLVRYARFRSISTMDILAHGLWATAAAKAANPKLEKPLPVGWFALLGVFPDLFAFGPRFVVMAWSRYVTETPVAAHSIRPGMDDGQPFFLRPWDLYQFSHSLVIFAIVFGLVWLIRRRPAWVMLAWPLHILMDIPTHSIRFFATPFLFPISSYQFDGISWGQPWFMKLNYGSLLAVYLFLLVSWLWRRRRQKGLR